MNIKKYKHEFRFLIFIIIIFLLWYLGRYFPVDTKNVEQYLKKFPVFYAGIIFIILYVIVTFFIWLSKDVFRFVAAVFFGAYISTLFIWIAETVNAFVLFHLARYLGRGFIENSLGKDSKNLDERLAKTNFFWLFLFRAAPLIPFRFLDLACGLTKISFKKYLLAVILGSLPRIFWVQFVLAGVGKSIFNNPYALTEYLMQNKTLFVFSFLYLLLVFLAVWKIKLRR